MSLNVLFLLIISDNIIAIFSFRLRVYSIASSLEYAPRVRCYYERSKYRYSSDEESKVNRGRDPSPYTKIISNSIDSRRIRRVFVLEDLARVRSID